MFNAFHNRKEKVGGFNFQLNLTNFRMILSDIIPFSFVKWVWDLAKKIESLVELSKELVFLVEGAPPALISTTHNITWQKKHRRRVMKYTQ